MTREYLNRIVRSDGENNRFTRRPIFNQVDGFGTTEFIS